MKRLLVRLEAIEQNAILYPYIAREIARDLIKELKDETKTQD